MKKIIRYNPAVSTTNLGDQIIEDSIDKELRYVFTDAFNIDVSTHLPISYIYSKLLENADYKFVFGTNLLMGKLNGFFRQWDVNIFNAKRLGPAILIGAGWWQYNNNSNLYTRTLYKKILSKEYLHSVRDTYTKEMLSKIGINNVLCTACPTMWCLTKEHCKQIPESKAQNVITTLTDYNMNVEADNILIRKLLENYRNVYIWLQGLGDYEYLRQLKDSDKVRLVEPSLKSYDEILTNLDIEYIGTRLHGGIRALQKKRRTLIVGVDNRAVEKKKDFDLDVIQRKELSLLENFIYEKRKMKVNIPEDEIKKWKSQFIGEI